VEDEKKEMVMPDPLPPSVVNGVTSSSLILSPSVNARRSRGRPPCVQEPGLIPDVSEELKTGFLEIQVEQAMYQSVMFTQSGFGIFTVYLKFFMDGRPFAVTGGLAFSVCDDKGQILGDIHSPESLARSYTLYTNDNPARRIMGHVIRLEKQEAVQVRISINKLTCHIPHSPMVCVQPFIIGSPKQLCGYSLPVRVMSRVSTKHISGQQLERMQNKAKDQLVRPDKSMTRPFIQAMYILSEYGWKSKSNVKNEDDDEEAQARCTIVKQILEYSKYRWPIKTEERRDWHLVKKPMTYQAWLSSTQ
jgi:hypothetical protein